MKKHITQFVIVMLLSIYISGIYNLISFASSISTDSLTIAEDPSDTEQYYGILYGDVYSDTDDTKWLTLKLGERGFRILNRDGAESIMIDQYGGIYINGEQFIPQKTENGKFAVNGGVYLLLILISNGIAVYSVILTRRIQKNAV